MSRNYVSTDWQNGQYEVYIPTRESLESNMQFFRIAIKVTSEVDNATARTLAQTLQKPQITPIGIIDSELQVIIAPKLKSRGFIRGFKHTKKPGYLTAVVVSKIPEIAFKRILVLVAKFLEKRLDKLLERLDFQPWQLDYRENKTLYYTIMRSIIERYSHSIALTIKSFSHVLSWVKGKLRSILHEIGLQNMAKLALRPLEQLSRNDRIEVLERIKAVLMAQTITENIQVIVTQKIGEPISEGEAVEPDSVLTHLYALATAKPVDSEPPRHHHRIHQHGEIRYV
jgi:hypothetical protein